MTTPADRMRAAQVSQLGEPPVVGEVPRPVAQPHQALIQVTSAALNPVTLSTASGVFYGGHPQLPYIPGTEGAGIVVQGTHLAPGTRVRFEASEQVGGALAEFCAAAEAECVELPDGLGDDLAAGLGVAGLAAWLALRDAVRLQPGERVLILGATGAVGQIAVQSARIMGAGRVVAAGRDRRVLEHCLTLGADAIVAMTDAQTDQELALAFTEAAQGPIEVVFDPVFGLPSRAASQACGLRARLVNLGQSAGAEATYRSRDIRGKLLTIVGHANWAAAPEVRSAAFRELAEHAVSGRIQLSVEAFPLAEVALAWARQQQSPHGKVVVKPR
ncbi:MAG: quinone oxidoreductase family protein [Candidatus Dormibacteria bacterium]